MPLGNIQPTPDNIDVRLPLNNIINIYYPHNELNLFNNISPTIQVTLTTFRSSDTDCVIVKLYTGNAAIVGNLKAKIVLEGNGNLNTGVRVSNETPIGWDFPSGPYFISFTSGVKIPNSTPIVQPVSSRKREVTDTLTISMYPPTDNGELFPIHTNMTKFDASNNGYVLYPDCSLNKAVGAITR